MWKQGLRVFNLARIVHVGPVWQVNDSVTRYHSEAIKRQLTNTNNLASLCQTKAGVSQRLQTNHGYLSVNIEGGSSVGCQRIRVCILHMMHSFC